MKTETWQQFQERLRRERRFKMLSNDLMQAVLADEKKLEEDQFARDMGVDDNSFTGPAEN